ncbi:MAG: hypothetical protein Q8L78_06420 [Coxiellaceae bacterium]|nr:hypothetical protein [Coxiellaceae bacterium]
MIALITKYGSDSMPDKFSDKIDLVKPLIEKFDRAAYSVSHNLYRHLSHEDMSSIFQTELDHIKAAISQSVFKYLFEINDIDLLGFYRKQFLTLSPETVAMHQSQITEHLLAQGLIDYIRSAFFIFLRKSLVQNALAEIVEKAEVVNSVLQEYLASDKESFDAASAAIDAYCELVADKIKENEKRMMLPKIKTPDDIFYLKKLNLFFDTPQGSVLRFNLLCFFYQEFDRQLQGDPGFGVAQALLHQYHVLLANLSIQQRNFRAFLESKYLSRATIEIEYEEYFSHVYVMQEEAYTEISTFCCFPSDDHDAKTALDRWKTFLEKDIPALYKELSDENEMLEDRETDTPQVTSMNPSDVRSGTVEFSEPVLTNKAEEVGELPEFDPRVEHFDVDDGEDEDDDDEYIVLYRGNCSTFFSMEKQDALCEAQRTSDSPRMSENR